MLDHVMIWLAAFRPKDPEPLLMKVVWCRIGDSKGNLWDLGSQPAGHGCSLRSHDQKFLLAMGMYIAMILEADNMLGHKN